VTFRSTYDPGVEVAGREVLCLHRNENLFVGPEWSIETARRLVPEAAVSSYPDATSAPLRTALGEHYGVGPERVFVGNGSDEVLADLLSLLRAERDELWTLDVCFGVYPMLAERLGYERRVLPGRSFETGRIDADGFDGLAVVDSPNGMSGVRFDPAEVLALAADPRAYLIWDNVYGEYAGDSLPSDAPPNVAFVRSFSKFYGLAGLRVGYCIAAPPVVARLLERKDAFNVNGFGQVMALEALRRASEFEALRDELLTARVELVGELEGLGLDVRPSEIVAVLARHPRVPAAELQAELLRRGVAVRRFADGPISDWVRITVAPKAPRERLLAALTAILSDRGR